MKHMLSDVFVYLSLLFDTFSIGSFLHDKSVNEQLLKSDNSNTSEQM